MAGSQRKAKERLPSDYAREALSEWGKAARYGARAVAPAVRGISSATAEYVRRRGESSVGNLADAALSKFGPGGKLGSKLGLGGAIVKRLRAGSASGNGGSSPSKASSNGNGFSAEAPIPIQESIEVAIPLAAAYSLSARFEEYTEFLDRVESAEVIDDTHVTFVAKVRGRSRELEVEIVDERPNERIDWVCAGEIAHSGVISFHPLAPRLTHIELTVELEPEGIVERLTRSAHLSERAIRTELHRFKAYADLWEEPDTGDEAEPVDDEAPVEEEGAVDEEEIDDEEPLDEEGVEDEEPVDEEELEEDEEPLDEEELDDEEPLEEDEEPVDDEEELEDAEYEDDEELEPAEAER